MGRLCIILAAVALLGIAPADRAAAQEALVDELARAGVALYEIGDHHGAIGAFQQAVGEGATDPDLYYSLGAAHMTVGSPAVAILNFRRTLALDPSDQEAASGLRAARLSLDGVGPPGTPLLAGTYDTVLRVVPSQLLAAIAVGLSFLAALSWISFRIARRRQIQIAAAGTLTALVLAAAFAALVAIGHTRSIGDDAVLSHRTAMFSGPGTEYVELLSVPAGAEVSILDDRGEWVRLELPPGEYGRDVQGWATSNSIDRVQAW